MSRAVEVCSIAAWIEACHNFLRADATPVEVVDGDGDLARISSQPEEFISIECHLNFDWVAYAAYLIEFDL